MYQGEYETYLDNVDYKKVIETLNIEGAEWEYFGGNQRVLKPNI